MDDWRTDLHTHSTASDGTMTPAELVRYAAEKRLRAFALTDHDCIDGVREATAEGERLGIEIIPAIEISAEYSEGTMHILGFFVDIQREGLLNQLKRLQQARAERNPQIVQKLQEQGLDITMEEVVGASGGGLVGRPHFAKVLVQKRHVSGMSEAFERYLKKGAPAYVEKFRFSPKESIAMIHEAGGVAVLAHPFTLRKNFSDVNEDYLDSLLPILSADGLDGMEVLYGTYSSEQTNLYRRLADKHHLLPSGGSDYHGTHKPTIDLGVGQGRLQIPYELIEALRRKAQSYGPAHADSKGNPHTQDH